MTALSTISVALVEDRPDVRDSLRALIGDTPGYVLVGAYGSMEDALAGVEERLPDAMVIDLGLPGMTGIDGIRLLHDRYPRLAMIVFTVFDDDQRIFEAICAGAQGYLLKNATPAALLSGIREIIEGGAPMSPAIARRVMDLFRQFQPPPAAAHDLTPHELRVLRLMAEGHNLKTAGKELGVSLNTVGFHMKRIYAKLHVHSKVEAVAKALRHGWLRQAANGHGQFAERGRNPTIHKARGSVLVTVTYSNGDSFSRTLVYREDPSLRG